MRYLFLLLPVMIIGIHASPAFADCAIDPDWPKKPCLDTPPYTLEEEREAWAPYYSHKGEQQMEKKRLEMEAALHYGKLEDWKNASTENYNVWYYNTLFGDISQKAEHGEPQPEPQQLPTPQYCGEGAVLQDGICQENAEPGSSVWGNTYQKIILSPLKQFHSGISFAEIECRTGLQLTQKHDGTPACVTPETYYELIKRDWVSEIIKAIQSRDIFDSTPEPEPEQFPLGMEGDSYSDFKDIANEKLGWITFPKYLPDGISLVGVQQQEEGLAYVIFGNSKTVGLDGTLQENIQTGIVVIFFVEGIVSEYDNWEESAQRRAENSVLHTVSKSDNITILLADGNDDNSAFYRDGRYTINVISNIYETDALERILRSMLFENKGVLQTGLTPEDFGETIVDDFEITLTKDSVEVTEGGKFEHVQVLLWSKDNQDSQMISDIPDNWRVGVAEDSDEMIKNWLEHSDPTLPHGIGADLYTDGTNTYVEVRNYPAVPIPTGKYDLRVIWESHQTHKWDSTPLTVYLVSGD